MKIGNIIEKIKSNNPYKGECKVALFSHNLSSICFARISSVENITIIIVYNHKLEMLGHLQFSQFSKDVFYLDIIYTHHDYRGLGIGKQMLNLMNQLLKEKEGKFIYGSYSPLQLEKTEKVICSSFELESRATHFYNSNGFDIIPIEKVKSYSEFNCKELNVLLNLEKSQKIIYKKIDKEKNYQFKEYDGLYIHDNLYKLKEKNVTKKIDS